MERSPICPNCLSKFSDIRGMLYRDGKPIGERCEDDWHRGAGYDPNRWELSSSDIAWLSEGLVSTR